MKNIHLRSLYRRMNRLYFGNRLPNRNVSVRFCKDKKIDGDLAEVSVSRDDGKIVGVQILINSRFRFSKRCCARELIHEMCHLAAPCSGDHGPAFWTTMAKVLSRGAIEWL